MSSSDEGSNLDPIELTLENFESRLSAWTKKELHEVLQKQTQLSNRIPTEIQEALLFHKMIYIKIKSMLSLIGNISEKVVNSWL
jgi:hypothetical protein